MWKFSEFVKDMKSKNIEITSTNGKLHLSFNLLVAIILTLAAPQLAVLVVILALVEYLDVTVQPNNKLVSEYKEKE